MLELNRQNIRKIIHTLRINIKSLAAESKIIRHELSKCKSYYEYEMLRKHKVTVVREEARRAQLLLAFFKGVPYKSVESYTNKPINLVKMADKLGRNLKKPYITQSGMIAIYLIEINAQLKMN